MMKEEVVGKNNYKENEENPAFFETSIFFEPRAIWALIFFLLLAIWYKFVPLIVVGTFLLFLYTIITLWKKRSLTQLAPALQLSKSRLFVDENFLIDASLYNNKWLPLIWVEWCFSKTRGIALGDQQEDVHTVRFLWLLWFQKVKWTLQGKALRRGVYNIGEITLRSGDGFRFAEIEKVHHLDASLYVYPKLLPVYVPNFATSMQWGVKGKKGGFIEDPLLVNGIREYQVGDEFKRLNWRASSRTGKLQVNVYQPVVTRELMIYVDVKGFVINESAYEDPMQQKAYKANREESFEEFLSIIASLAVKYGDQQVDIGFSSNGLDFSGKRMPYIPPSTVLTPFLDQLAKITQRLGMPKMSALDKIIHRGRLYSPLFIFCDGITEEHYLWYQQYKYKLAEVCFYYKRETEYAKRLALVAKPMNRLLAPIASSKGGA